MKRTILLSLVLALTLASSAQAAFPGRNGRIALFQDEVNASPHGISSVRSNGSDLRGIGPTCQRGVAVACPKHPAWSPGGTRIAFEQGGRIGVMRFNGTAVRYLNTPGIVAFRPAWNPTGNTLVFEGIQNGRRNLFLIGANGTALRRLTGLGGAHAAWSTDNVIAFVRNRQIHVLHPNGRLRRLTGAGGEQPNWSPSGDLLVFVRNGNLHRMTGEGGGLFRITGAGGREPAWTPDGQAILFDRIDGPNRRILRVAPDRSGLTLVTQGVVGSRVAVNSPDQQPVGPF